ncbi:MAG: hypothetical protein WBW55_11925 [Desulfobaccales bacterium]
MKQTISIIIGFLPWIVFGVVAGPSLWRLNAAIIAALALVLVLGYKQLAKGFILTWGSLLFFGIILVMVVLCRNLWVINNLDILSQGALAAIAWLSIFIGKPFVLQYARETVPPERQALPTFYSTCRTLAVIWGVIFLIGTGMTVAKSYGWLAGGMGYQAVSLGLIGLGLGLNHWYPQYVRSRAKLYVNPDQPG